MSVSPRKNCPLKSHQSTILVSEIVNSLQPPKTKFFAISTPKPPRPKSNMLALLCLDTA